MSDPAAFRDASALVTALVSDDVESFKAIAAECAADRPADTINALAVWAHQVVKMHAAVLRGHMGMSVAEVESLDEEQAVTDRLEVVAHVAQQIELAQPD